MIPLLVIIGLVTVYIAVDGIKEMIDEYKRY